MTTQITDLQLEQPGEELQEVASGLHGEVGALVIGALVSYVYAHDLGRVFTAQTTFKVSGAPPNRQPDAAFVSAERMPEIVDEDVPYAPDLAVEVISRTDDWSELVNKAENYLKNGVRMVWIIDPYGKGAFIHRPGRPVRLLNLTDELDGEEVLPGFKMPVKALFPKGLI